MLMVFEQKDKNFKSTINVSDNNTIKKKTNGNKH